MLTCHSAFYGEGSKKTQLNWAFELVSQALENTIMEEISKNGTYDRPWVEEKLNELRCEYK